MIFNNDYLDNDYLDNDYLDNDYSDDAYGDNSEWVRQYYLKQMEKAGVKNE